ncbi:MAG: thiamine-phosphate kinase [Gammaproteobacteria bacterium]|nr:thiamine-phosphate kinase [Gammaproteobacteria bacterium]
MASSEFELIKQHFSHLGSIRKDVVLGVGDDCALLSPLADQVLAVSMDTLVAGVHFLVDVDPETLGHKALAVNLSDLAAMGATPAWVTLALTLPEKNDAWLSAFCSGFGKLAIQHNLQLVGGDTTRGPLSITVQVHGYVPAGQALRRVGAAVGDQIYLTGTLGDAGLSLKALQGELPLDQLSTLRSRLERPTPRIGAGVAMRGVAHAAIDLSDGLLADLGHICEASGVGARIELSLLPLSIAVATYIKSTGDWQIALAGGDDYELCVTVPPHQAAELEQRIRELKTPLTRIGSIESGDSIRVIDTDGSTLQIEQRGYDHFRKAPPT